MKAARYAYTLGVAVCFAATGQVALSQDASAPTRAGASKEAQPPAEKPAAVPGAGMKIHVDPQTGAVIPEPAPGTPPLELSPQERNALSTSHEGLTEVQSSVPGGGYSIDLQGRFQSPLTATIGPDGKARIGHEPLGTPSGEKK
jgi:hypothetical protein